MKTYRSILAVVSVFTAVAMQGCGNTKSERPDGWYLITDGEIADAPIVTVEDFDTVELISLPSEEGDVYQIVGRLKADKVALWADATEEAAGEIFGFVFDGEVISAPRVNCRIESGCFAISQPPSAETQVRLKAVYDELKERMGTANTNETDGDVSGVYVGTVPAADCPGIIVTLVLNDNGTYTMRMDYIDRDAAFDEQGAYRTYGDKLIATNEEGSSTMFAIEDGRLRMLDTEGNAVEGALADNYLLHKR